MPRSSGGRSKKQAARERRQLGKLRDLGLISNKTDLRKAPGKAARSALSKYRDVIENRAKVIRTPKAKAFGEQFRRKGDLIIVPRAKGERIRADKAGDLILTRKTKAGRIRRREIRPAADVRTVRPPRPARRGNVVRVVSVQFGHGERQFSEQAFRDFAKRYPNIKKYDALIETEDMEFDDREEAAAYRAMLDENLDGIPV